MRRELLLIAGIAAVGLAVRVYPAWPAVYANGEVNFLETDAWYHVRLVENQVHNFPWRVTLDPYAAPGGQFVPIAPLYDTLTAALVVLWHGGEADTVAIERVAAIVPPMLGTLAVVATWALGRRVFGPRAGLLAASLLAILPGHFLDRTMLGFVDHHALEALLSLTTLLAIVHALPAPAAVSPGLAGLSLGCYLLAWASGAFLVAVLGLWLIALLPLARADDLRRAASLTAGAALVALVLVLAFQDPRMHRYGSQVFGLVGLAAAAVVLRRWGGGDARARTTSAALLAALAGVALLAAWWRAPGLVDQLTTDLGRLTPDPARMGVLEARPLFRYAGYWRWAQPWDFYRTGFYVGLIALVPLGLRIVKHRQPADVLIWLFVVATLVATIGQNRFGYYLMPACALVGGFLVDRVIRWGSAPRAAPADAASAAPAPLWREVAALAVIAATFGPCLSPSLLLRARGSSLTSYWRETMTWIRTQTPPPFAAVEPAGNAYYLARYSPTRVPAPDYTVMNWWDQGYWLIERARRVPVSNPTQARAPNAAIFYAETDGRQALELLRRDEVRYVMADWELPFRRLEDGTIMGRFQNVLDWAGATHADYYDILYRRTNGGWTAVWVFFEPYYRSMAYRLAARGGDAVSPTYATSVVTVADRVDQGGRLFRELLTAQTYPTYEAARSAAASHPAPDTLIVGMDPWRSAFPIEAMPGLDRVFAARTPEQAPSQSAWVTVYQVRGVR